MHSYLHLFWRFIVVIILCIGIMGMAKAQTNETFPANTYVIDMGVTPQTVANSLKPYGLVYALLQSGIPVKWSISGTKAKDGIDFTGPNGKAYKGGPFIVSGEFASMAASIITAYKTANPSVVVDQMTAAFSAPIVTTLKAAPRWTLDAQNGSIAQGYLVNAGIPATSYNYKDPQLLAGCDDIFVMPHADPKWSTHSNLLAWNQTYRGAIWAACHAVSAMENMFDPANPAQQTNFLSETTATATGSGPYANNNSGKGNSLILWGSHSDGSTPPPYQYAYQNDPVMQFLGRLDAATQNGSEQIYLPFLKGANPTWRTGANGTKIAVWDDSQANVPGISPGKAAIVAYGSAFGDANRGKVMYEAGHSHNKGSAEDVAAQRAFMNFSLWASQDKALSVAVGGVTSLMTVNTAYPLTTNVTATIPSGPYTYVWTASCPGTFSPSNTDANPTFTPTAVSANCVISVKVTDACGRTSSESTPVVVQLGPQPPVCVNDAIVVDAACGQAAPVTIKPLDNDSDPINAALSFMLLDAGNPVSSVTTADGTFTKTDATTVTFTPVANFVGTASVQYSLTNSLNLSSICTISVTLGTADANGCLPGQAPDLEIASAATAVTTATGVTNSANAVGDPDYDPADVATYAVVGSGDVLTLDLGSIKTNTIGTPTDSVRVYFASASDGTNTTIQVEFSTDNTVFTSAGTSITDLLDGTNVAFAVPGGGVRYIKITRTAGANINVDAAQYETYSCASALPQASNDAISLVEDDRARFDPTANDMVPGTIAYIKVLTQPANGKAVQNIDGTISYQPNNNFSGTDSFTYQVCNTSGYCGTATVTATVSEDGCIPDLVAGVPQYRPLDLGASITKTLNSSLAGVTVIDSWIKQDGADANKNYGNVTTLEAGKKPNKARRALFEFDWTTAVIPAGAVIQSAQLSVFRKGGDSKTLSMSVYELTEAWTEGAGGSSNVTWNNRTTGTPWSTAGGVFTSTPAATINVDSKNNYKTWTITDLVQSWNDTPASNFGVLLKQTVETAIDSRHQFSSDEDKAAQRPKLIVKYATRLACQAVPNRKPLAGFDYETTDSQTPKTINVLANDSDPDNNLNNASLAVIGSVTGGSAVVQSGQILFTPTTSFNGQASFMYLIGDNGSPALTDTAFVYVTVTNAPPKANNDVATVLSNTTNNTINISTNDVHLDGPNPLTTTITAAPANGTATVSGGNIIYTPDANFTGTDVLTYQICEPANGASCNPTPVCATATLTITVQNRPPVATIDTKAVNPCQPTIIQVLSNDSDPENGTLTITITVPPTKGTAIVQNGTIVYTATQGQSGSDILTYQICDDGVTPLCATANVNISINNPAVNTNAPLAVNDAESLYQGQTVYVAVLSNDSEPDGQSLVITGVSGVTNGTATIVGNLIEFVPNPGFSGQVVFQYTVCDVFQPSACPDPMPLCATANITIDVLKQPIPIAVADNRTTAVNTPITINVTSNDDFGTDGPNTASAITITGNPSNGGTVTVVDGGTGTQADDKIFYTPALNFTGTETFKYTICDANGDCSEALVTVIVSGAPSIKLIKSISSITDNAPTGRGVGDVINYTFTVTNTGAVTLSNVSLTDTKLGLSNVAVAPGTLAPAATGTATATYTITQADVNAGGIENTATVTGTPPSGPNVTDVSDTGTDGNATAIVNPDATESPKLNGTTDNDPTNDPTVLLIAPAPSIKLIKSISSITDNAPVGRGVGDVINYTFTVTNTGNVTLTGIVLSDAKLGLSNLAITPGTLAPAATGTATATYTITQADVNAGGIENTATVTGTPPSGPNVTDISDTGTDGNATAIVNPDATESPKLNGTTDNDPTNDPTVLLLPKVKLVKTGMLSSATQISYTFTVTNTGNVTLSNLTIADPKLALTNLAVTPSTLAPNAVGTATATYTITQADITAGEVKNTATVTGTPPTGPNITDVSDSGDELVDTPADPDSDPTNDPTVLLLPKVKLVKTGMLSSATQISYTFTVTNTGNVTLSNLTIADPKLSLTNLAVTPSTLAPNAVGTATATYTITQADITAGEVKNTATVTGQTPDNVPVTDVSDSGDELVDTPADPDSDPTNDPTVVPLPKIGIAKSVVSVVDNSNGTFDVAYRLKVKNVANVALSDIQVRDTLSNTFPIPAAFTVISWSSPTFTMNSGYTGTGINTALLTATGNSLAIGDSAFINLTVRVTPGPGASVYYNSAYASGKTPNGTLVTDKSQLGNDVDPDLDLDPGNNFVPTPVSFSIKPPIATDDINNTLVNIPVSGNVLTNDDDPQKLPLTVNTTIPAICPPQHGSVIMQANGDYTYTPQTGFVGTDRFCYIVCNSLSLCDTATVTIDIMPLPQVNSVIANDDATQTQQGTPVKIVVKANDFDPQGDNLGAVTKISNPLNGTAIYNPADSSFTYTPTGSFKGKDTFMYVLCDVKGACDTAIVTIDVIGTIAGNDPPVAMDDASITPVNTAVSGTSAKNDSDPNNDPLTFTKLSNPSHGSVIFNSDGTYTYTPTFNYTGPDRFIYAVCDNQTPNLCDTATVYITVLPIPGVTLLPKVYLQGSLFGVFSGSLMRDDLRVKNLIPRKSPYVAWNPITQADTITLNTVLAVTGADAIVDWVFVELRDAADSTKIVDSRSALVQRDGDIVDVDGTSSLKFTTATSAKYFVAIRHRNHLGVMSKTALPLSQIGTTIDFRLTTTPTYVLAASPIHQSQVDVVQGKALWAGNALYDNQVIYQGTDNDVNVVYQQVINATGNFFKLPFYILPGYYTGDINMDGEVIFQGTTNDVEYIYQNIINNHNGNGLKQNYFIIQEQLPK